MWSVVRCAAITSAPTSLQDVISLFGSTPDPDFPEHGLLELYQAQVCVGGRESALAYLVKVTCALIVSRLEQLCAPPSTLTRLPTSLLLHVRLGLVSHSCGDHVIIFIVPAPRYAVNG